KLKEDLERQIQDLQKKLDETEAKLKECLEYRQKLQEAAENEIRNRDQEIERLKRALEDEQRQREEELQKYKDALAQKEKELDDCLERGRQLAALCQQMKDQRDALSQSLWAEKQKAMQPATESETTSKRKRSEENQGLEVKEAEPGDEKTPKRFQKDKDDEEPPPNDQGQTF